MQAKKKPKDKTKGRTAAKSEPSSRTVDDSWNTFEEIVEVLANRYQSQSLDIGGSRPTSVLVVLGDGVSAWSQVPAWQSEELRRDVIATVSRTFQGFVDEAWRCLVDHIGTPDPQWDADKRAQKLAQLANTELLCNIATRLQTVTRDLQRLMLTRLASSTEDDSAGAAPQLAYELLAHLAKHGFIDDILSFSLDTILDDAVENEIGSGEYCLIQGGQGAPQPLATERPLIIKAYGSATQNSLRLSKEGRLRALQAVLRLLDRKVFQGPDKAYVISIGYEWSDPEFVRWIEARADRIVGVSVIQAGKSEPSTLRSLHKAMRILDTADITDPGFKPLSVDHLLWALWMKLEQKLNPPEEANAVSPTPVVPASRHLLLGWLFGPELDGKGDVCAPPVNAHTRKKRFAIEVLLHIVKCRGMVNASVMAHDPRIQRYRGLVGQSDAHEVIDELLTESEFPDVKDTYYCSGEVTADFNKILDIEFATRSVVRPVLPDKKGRKIALGRLDPAAFIEGEFDQIFGGPEVEFVRTVDPQYRWLFDEPIALASYPHLYRSSQELLDQEWSHLLVVAESGEWLSEDRFNRHEGGRVCLLVAETPQAHQWPRRDQVIEGQIQLVFNRLEDERGIECTIGVMPWWEHNRHLTLALDVEADNPFLGAVFFFRPNKRLRVSPVLLKEPRDCAEVLCTMYSYARRAVEAVPSSPGNGELAKQLLEVGERIREKAPTEPTDMRVRLDELVKKLEESLDVHRVEV